MKMQNKQKLHESEILLFNSLIEDWITLNKTLAYLTKKFEELENSRNYIFNEISDLNNKISQNRLAEIKFKESLIQKYGEFTLDISTYEITPTDI